MRISAVQIRSLIGDVEYNINRHLHLIDRALQRQSRIVFFPELSLTGYTLQYAQTMALTASDPRLQIFQARSDIDNLTIGIGAPLVTPTGIQISMIWFTPRAPRRLYAKQLLHSDEQPYFVSGEEQLLLTTDGWHIAPAICYESLQPEHAQRAAALGASIYLASVAKPARNLAQAFTHYPAIARRHHMFVMMANSIGGSIELTSAGQSAAWDPQGILLAHLDDVSEGIITLDTAQGRASVDRITLEQR